MKSLISTLLFFSLITSGFCQDDREYIQNQRFGGLDAQYMLPIAMGDNFINKGYGTVGGGTLSIYGSIVDHVYLGGTFQIFSNNVTDIAYAGNLEYTNVSFLGITAGYKYDISPKMSLYSDVNFGAVWLRSYSKEGFDVKDNGFGVSLKTQLAYQLVSVVHITAGVGYRHDFLDIQAPAGYEKFFRNVNYLIPTIGIKIQ